MKTRVLKSAGLLAICLGGLVVAEDAYAFTGWAGFGDSGTGNSSRWGTSSRVGNGAIGFLNGVFGNLGKSTWTVTPEVTASMDYNNPGNIQAVISGQADFFTWNGGSTWVVDPGFASSTSNGCSNNSTTTYDPEPLSQPSGATRWGCYIDSVYDSTGNSFSNWSDLAFVQYDGATGVNGGRGNASIQCWGHSQAHATCISITNYMGSWAVGSPSSTVGWPLASVDWTNGTICELRGIWGNFRSNSSSSGVYTTFGSTQWQVVTSPGVGAFVDCAQ